MEILFMCNNKVFYFENDEVCQKIKLTHDEFIHYKSKGIKHLDEVKVLYHYNHNATGEILTVYYEHNNRVITKLGNSYYIININNNYIKDYTLTNLNLLDDGDII